METWLDTETKAILQPITPGKLAPPTTGRFSLVLLKKGSDVQRLERSLGRVHGVSLPKAAILVVQSCPIPICNGLSYSDALFGQFELICCDSISIFVKSEVVSNASSSYLFELYSQVQFSPEFENVTIDVRCIPNDGQGKRLIDQFFGDREALDCYSEKGFSFQKTMMRKKARIMEHWTKKIGGEAVIVE